MDTTAISLIYILRKLDQIVSMKSLIFQNALTKLPTLLRLIPILITDSLSIITDGENPQEHGSRKHRS